jgi:hypothetical protein
LEEIQGYLLHRHRIGEHRFKIGQVNRLAVNGVFFHLLGSGRGICLQPCPGNSQIVKTRRPIDEVLNALARAATSFASIT